MAKNKSNFIPQEPQDMKYHEHFDYWVCLCGNFEKAEGFMACTAEGDLISPFGAYHGRCERCGSVIHWGRRQIIGINPNPNRGRF